MKCPEGFGKGFRKARQGVSTSPGSDPKPPAFSIKYSRSKNAVTEAREPAQFLIEDSVTQGVIAGDDLFRAPIAFNDSSSNTGPCHIKVPRLGSIPGRALSLS